MKYKIIILVVVILFSLTFIVAQSLITFDRDLNCQGCGQHKAPPSTNVNMTVSVSSDSSLENETLIDYFQVEWIIVDDYGGTVEGYNETYNKISWGIATNVTEVESSYIIQSPDLTTPPTKYYFFSSIENETSEPWQVIVSDARPPEPSWETGYFNFTIWESDDLSWNSGTRVCEANLTDDKTATVNCSGLGVDSNKSYRVQMILKNNDSSTTDILFNGSEYVWHMNVKLNDYWSGSDSVLSGCGFGDFGGDDGISVCNVSFVEGCNEFGCSFDKTHVRVQNLGGAVVVGSGGGIEGFMYLINTSEDVSMDNRSFLFFEYSNSINVSSNKILIPVDYANESEGRKAIEEGVNNSLPNNLIESDKQVYLFDGVHSLGRFDKLTRKNNQTWVFNYVTEGESLVDINSLFNVLNVWENESLTYGQIVGQVEEVVG